MSSTASESIIALADCNNFYCSCETVFQPKLKDQPVGVLSNGDGCVVARSTQLKALGVAMGEPAFKVRARLAGQPVHLLSSNYALYGDMSARVMQILSLFTPSLEVYSIDEAFLDLSQIQPHGSGLANYAGCIQSTVQQWTGIPVSIGIAPTKTLAKVANKHAKQNSDTDGITVLLEPDLQQQALNALPVTELWGISSRLGKKLHALGITTAAQLCAADPVWIRQLFSVTLERLVRELNGQSCIALETVQPAKKSICVSRSFGHNLTELADIQAMLAQYVARAAEKLRRQHSICRGLLVFLHTDRFATTTPYRNSVFVPLAVATQDTRVLLHHAQQGLKHIYQLGFEYKKTGVLLLDLMPDTVRQHNLFEAEETESAQRLMQTLDQINQKFGRHTIRPARQTLHPRGAVRATRKSPAYTTRWQDLPIAKACSPS